MQSEIKAYLEEYPDTEIVQFLLADMNGIYRGKQATIDALKGVVYFPITTCFLTTDGANADTILDDYGSDPDRPCVPVPGSLRPVPWARRPTVQVLLTMQDKDGSPFFMDPRVVLSKALAPYKAANLKPVVAIEYEFYLFEIGSNPPKPVAPPNGMPMATGANCYNMDVFYDFEDILQEIEDDCLAQGIPVSGLVCEYGNGQFEVNINHSDDALRVCDEAMMLKRVVKSVALKHGLHASFMAKPTYDEAGSGMHAHVSVLDASGANIFAGEQGRTALKHAVGGLLTTMNEATALFAPNANSYRRFDPEWFAPMVPNWGENNRRLSVRLPMSDDKNRRFEHRVCGADASPHLMLAAILVGAWHGMAEKIDPGEKTGELELVDFTDCIPSRWYSALEALKEGTVMKKYLGEDFIELYHRVRASEENDYHRSVPQADHEKYLRVL
ncbi:glutamine synthetase [Kordiimonas sediminis]|uniref:Glutamine synthetase n=1 Tax=Kordiimonas sediminis TaxID=1735581 RepID=A0A919AU24_9PROT|nr:glutamine synthetase family protein [Kordiimonas sediminis]GHF26170.1 glutamine synthetase [Kordiimonas sediminis]